MYSKSKRKEKKKKRNINNNLAILPSHDTCNERVQKGIAYWNKQNNDMPVPSCMLKVQEEIIKDEGYR